MRLPVRGLTMTVLGDSSPILQESFSLLSEMNCVVLWKFDDGYFRSRFLQNK